METSHSSNNMKSGQHFVRGWSWGDVKLSSTQIDFSGGDLPWFTIPYQGISNVQQVSSKNEIALEFNIDEDTDEKDYFLYEMRLYVPDKSQNDGNNEKVEKKEEGNSEENSIEEEKPVMKTSAEGLKEEISKLANLGTVSEAIAHVPEVQMITPRGKFDVYFMKNIMKIHGPMHNYKIVHKNISKVFLLPKPDGHHTFLVVALASPVRQGNTNYPFLVFQIKNKLTRTVNLNLPENENDRKEILHSDLSNPLTGDLIDILAKLFQSIVNVGIIIPGKTYYKSNNKGNYALKCSLKANEGFLYPLERSIVFLHKPVVCINIDDIRQVECARVQETNVPQRSFDMTIVTKKEEFQFLGIEKSEFENLANYFNSKKVKVNNLDDRKKIVDIPTTVSTSNRRQRKPIEEEPLELPSEESFVDDEEFSSGEDMNVEEEDDESEEDKKKTKKNKNKKK